MISQTLTTQTLVPLNFSAVVAPLNSPATFISRDAIFFTSLISDYNETCHKFIVGVRIAEKVVRVRG